MIFKKHIIYHLILLLLIFCSRNGYAQITSNEAGIISTIAGKGNVAAGFTGDGGQASGSLLNNPSSIAVDGAGNIYISDELNHRIRKVTKSTGVITTIAGTGVAGFLGDGGAATGAQLNHPSDITIDLSGLNIYFYDSLNFRIRKINLITGVISTIAGNGTQAYAGQTMPATNAGLSGVSGITILYQSYLFLSLGTSARICEIDLTTGNIFTIAGTGTAGYSGDGGQASNAAFNYPAGLCVDANGVIYVADCNNHRIRKIDTSGIVSTVAGNGSAGYSGDTAIANLASLNFPQGVSINNLGTLYIADKGNNRIRQVSKKSGKIYTIAGSGIAGYAGDGSFANTMCVKLFSPTTVRATNAGNLYIADLGNNCVRLMQQVLTININASFGIQISDTVAYCGSPFTVSIGRSISIDPGLVTYLGIEYKINGVPVPSDGFATIFYVPISGDVLTAELSFGTNCGIITLVSNPVVVNTPPPVTPDITLTESANNICTPSAVSFTATLVNEGTNPVCNCFVNNQLVFTSNSHNPTFTRVMSNGDNVHCVLRSSERCVTAPSVSSQVIIINGSPTLTPAVTITASAATICEGQAVTFNALATNSGTNPTYQWKVNGVDVGTGNPSFTSSTLQNGDLLSCTLKADTALPCVTNTTANSNSITINVGISSTNAAITIAVSDTTICVGNSVRFTASTQNAGNGPSYQWKVNGTNVGGNSRIYTTNNLANGDKVTCTITANTSACYAPVTSNEIIMTVRNSPTMILTADSTIITTGGTARLKAQVTGSIASYTWSPASLLVNPLSLQPVTKPITSTTEFSLSVTNVEGCTTVAKITIQVPSPLLMPSAFTPNNDGLNDIFRIPPGALTTLAELSVFDRWGKKIFTTKDASKGWDGRVSGAMQQNGAYVYFIRGTVQSIEVMLRGSVVLVR